MKNTTDTTVICTYRVRQGGEQDFIGLLKQHRQALKACELICEDPYLVYQGDDSGSPFFVEIFAWKDTEAPNTAHHHPAIMAVWEPMGKLCEERNGKPSMEFPHVKQLELPR
jgi:hypothetical protein